MTPSAPPTPPAGPCPAPRARADHPGATMDEVVRLGPAPRAPDHPSGPAGATGSRRPAPRTHGSPCVEVAARRGRGPRLRARADDPSDGLPAGALHPVPHSARKRITPTCRTEDRELPPARSTRAKPRKRTSPGAAGTAPRPPAAAVRGPHPPHLDHDALAAVPDPRRNRTDARSAPAARARKLRRPRHPRLRPTRDPRTEWRGRDTAWTTLRWPVLHASLPETARVPFTNERGEKHPFESAVALDWPASGMLTNAERRAWNRRPLTATRLRTHGPPARDRLGAARHARRVLPAHPRSTGTRARRPWASVGAARPLPAAARAARRPRTARDRHHRPARRRLGRRARPRRAAPCHAPAPRSSPGCTNARLRNGRITLPNNRGYDLITDARPAGPRSTAAVLASWAEEALLRPALATWAGTVATPVFGHTTAARLVALHDRPPLLEDVRGGTNAPHRWRPPATSPGRWPTTSGRCPRLTTRIDRPAADHRDRRRALLVERARRDGPRPDRTGPLTGRRPLDSRIADAQHPPHPPAPARSHRRRRRTPAERRRAMQIDTLPVHAPGARPADRRGPPSRRRAAADGRPGRRRPAPPAGYWAVVPRDPEPRDLKSRQRWTGAVANGQGPFRDANTALAAAGTTPRRAPPWPPASSRPPRCCAPARSKRQPKRWPNG